MAWHHDSRFSPPSTSSGSQACIHRGVCALFGSRMRSRWGGGIHINSSILPEGRGWEANRCTVQGPVRPAPDALTALEAGVKCSAGQLSAAMLVTFALSCAGFPGSWAACRPRGCRREWRVGELVAELGLLGGAGALAPTVQGAAAPLQMR